VVVTPVGGDSLLAASSYGFLTLAIAASFADPSHMLRCPLLHATVPPTTPECVYLQLLIHTGIPMRTNIVIDDELMTQVLKLTGIKTKREAVETGLKTLLKLQKQENIRNYRGKLLWTGDLDDMRSDT